MARWLKWSFTILRCDPADATRVGLWLPLVLVHEKRGRTEHKGGGPWQHQPLPDWTAYWARATTPPLDASFLSRLPFRKPRRGRFQRVSTRPLPLMLSPPFRYRFQDVSPPRLPLLVAPFHCSPRRIRYRRLKTLKQGGCVARVSKQMEQTGGASATLYADVSCISNKSCPVCATRACAPSCADSQNGQSTRVGVLKMRPLRRWHGIVDGQGVASCSLPDA